MMKITKCIAARADLYSKEWMGDRTFFSIILMCPYLPPFQLSPITQCDLKKKKEFTPLEVNMTAI